MNPITLCADRSRIARLKALRGKVISKNRTTGLRLLRRRAIRPAPVRNPNPRSGGFGPVERRGDSGGQIDGFVADVGNGDAFPQGTA